MQKQQAVHTFGGQRWEFYFSPIKCAILIPIRTSPIPIPISSPKLFPFPMGIPWEWEFPFPCTPLVYRFGRNIITDSVARTGQVPARTKPDTVGQREENAQELSN